MFHVKHFFAIILRTPELATGQAIARLPGCRMMWGCEREKKKAKF
jgi:hypothetical protein